MIALDVRDAIADSSFFAAATATATAAAMGRDDRLCCGCWCVSRSIGMGEVRETARGTTVAVTGDCPNCAERVYAFVPANKPEVRVKSECHVCERGVVFHAKVAKSDASRWGRVATGRIYLVSRTEDYYDRGLGTERAPGRRPSGRRIGERDGERNKRVVLLQMRNGARRRRRAAVSRNELSLRVVPECTLPLPPAPDAAHLMSLNTR